jgi:hypothetical protein
LRATPLHGSGRRTAVAPAERTRWSEKSRFPGSTASLDRKSEVPNPRVGGVDTAPDESPAGMAIRAARSTPETMAAEIRTHAKVTIAG